MKTCPKCKTEHIKSGTYCSRSCANSRTWTDEIRLKISLSARGKTPANKGTSCKIERLCLACSKSFICYPKSNKFYCSGKCNPKIGGYRNGSGRAKTGYYKGVYCGSTYELMWVIYQLDHNLYFDRFPTTLEYNGRKYIPDFLQNGKIIEIKGYEREETIELKNEVARKNGYDVIILRKSDLYQEFQWVKEHYTFKRVEELYDDFKPNFEYCCDNCGNVFHRHKSAKTNRVACSKSCAMKMNRQLKT